MVSFVIPAHNEAACLGAALDAIHDAMRGVGGGYEVIVVDDASTDGTAGIAAAKGARVVRVAHRQIAAARNAGAAVATGNVLVFVDADTMVNPSLLRAAFAAMDNGFVGGSARIVFDAPLPLWGWLFFKVFSFLYYAANLGAGCFFFVSAPAFRAVGGFPPDYFAGEETMLTLALKRRGRFCVLRETVTTSARKFQLYSGEELLRQLLIVLAGGHRAAKDRRRLAIWYDGRRHAGPRRGSASAPIGTAQ